MLSSTSPADSRPLISIEHVSKSFVGVNALSDVSFAIGHGEAVNLAGENGSGKSTLIKILAGAEKPNEGTITINGEQHKSLDPRLSVAQGIQVIFQDFSLFPNLSVAENIAFSRNLAKRHFLVDHPGMRSIAQKVLARIGVKIDLNARVESLSVADKQLVAIARALASEARLIIMDEPTTALTEREVRSLLEIIRRLKQEGVALLFVSHKLSEGLNVCEKVVVLRNGQKVAEAPADQIDAGELAFHMTGRRFLSEGKSALAPGRRVILRARGLSRKGKLTDASFDLAKGEVLGIAGLLGSGRGELAKALFGMMQLDAGDLEIEGRPVRLGAVRKMIDAGIGYVPEDRLTEGLFLSQSIARNIAIGTLENYVGKARLLEGAKLRQDVEDWLDRLKISASSIQAAVQSLSGGNQQRVVLARWLAKRPKILILNGPTVGVDIGSKADIHGIMDQLAMSGLGIIVISDDLPELLTSCNRILVMKEGRIAEEIAGGTVSEDEMARRLTS